MELFYRTMTLLVSFSITKKSWFLSSHVSILCYQTRTCFVYPKTKSRILFGSGVTHNTVSNVSMYIICIHNTFRPLIPSIRLINDPNVRGSMSFLMILPWLLLGRRTILYFNKHCVMRFPRMFFHLCIALSCALILEKRMWIAVPYLLSSFNKP